MPFDLLLIVQYFKHFTPSTPLTSKSRLIYNVDSNTKPLNYIKIWFKGLIYFELDNKLVELRINRARPVAIWAVWLFTIFLSDITDKGYRSTWSDILWPLNYGAANNNFNIGQIRNWWQILNRINCIVLWAEQKSYCKLHS